MDRLFLTDWGIGLSDFEFAMAIAALGALPERPLAWASNAEYSRRREQVRFGWNFKPTYRQTLPDAREFIDRWQQFIVKAQPLTFFVEKTIALSLGERIGFALGLSMLSEVKAVTVESEAPWVSVPTWSLPFFIATLPDDSATHSMTQRRKNAPKHWPYQYRVATKQNRKNQIFASSKSLSETLEKLETLPFKIESILAIINGAGDYRSKDAITNIDALASRLSLSGLVFLPEPIPTDEFAEKVDRLSYELTHDHPLDIALEISFGNSATLVGNASLLVATRMSSQVPRLSLRLRSMIRHDSVQVSANASQLLGLPSYSTLSGTRIFGLDRGDDAGVRTPSTVDFRTLLRSDYPREPAVNVERGLPFPRFGGHDNAGAAMILASKNFDYDQESREASALTELTDSLRVATAQAVADSNSARCVQEQSFINSPAGGEIVQIKDAYVVDEPVLLKVRIGSFAAPGWQSSAMPFPIDQLPPNESEHQLTLMLHEPTYCPQPKLKEILLPEWGPSSEAHFCFTPDAAGLFEGRITVLHRGRVLQTAMLRAEVFSSRALVGPGNEICLRDEVRVRRDWTSLDKREEFDLAIVCNHDGHETPRMTSVGAGRAWANDLSTIGAALEVINTSLSEVAMSTKDYKDGLDKGKNPALLTTLASAGHQLFGDLVVFQLDKNSTGDIALLSDQLTNVQIVSTREDSIVPLEFIYDYGAPEVGAIVCPHHRAALHRGRCDADCVGKLDPAKHVCPMGFWGVRLVIERHVFDASRSSNAEGELVVEVEATAARSRLDIRRRALLSYSDRVATATVAPLIGVLNDNTQFPVHVAKSWDLWADNVLQFGPSLLVAFPHNDGAGLNRSLEVQGMPFQTRLIHFYDLPRSKVTASTKWHVRAPHDSPPIVFLLGCDTTGTATDFGSHVKAFKRGGAAVVVSTVATVFGEHAVTVGTTIIAELLKRSASASLDAGQPGRLGEVLRDAKRQALLNSLPMAMCVVAFGDADWFL